MWVWEAGLPPNTKPPATTHYMLRLVGMGITSSLSVSRRTLAGGAGELRARAPVGGKAPGARLQEDKGWEPPSPLALYSLVNSLRPGLGKPGLWPADSGPQVKEKELEFGNVLVNSKQSRSLMLLNDGNCTLYYHLFLEQCSPQVVDNGPLGTRAQARAGAREASSEG